MKLSDLFRPQGTINRKTYVVVGLVGFALKHNLDRLVATFGFHRPWSLFNYWMPVRDVARVTQLSHSEAVFLASMVAMALPFIWVGVVLTLKRLRSADLPSWLVCLFFVPFLNLAFFLYLSLVPERPTHPPLRTGPRWSPALFMPVSALGSAALTLLITVPFGLALVYLGVTTIANYGWGLFVALPFVMGLAASVLYGMRAPRSLGGCIKVACFSVLILGAGLLALAIEGILCLAMAVPIALPLAALGGACGYFVQRQRWSTQGGAAFVSAVLLIVPGVQVTELLLPHPSSTFVVRSAVDIQAPPQAVWNEVVAFSQIPSPKEWFFRSGIAYPIRAEIQGRGPGAERHCVFSTGAFIEPIQVWDEPRLLKFSVTQNPSPLQEWTPYVHIEPRHLDGYFVSNGGQFLLTPLPNGGTHLEGTTWYQHGLWPEAYWRLWSDAIIHRIHMRVLNHIQSQAESKLAINQPHAY